MLSNVAPLYFWHRLLQLFHLVADDVHVAMYLLDHAALGAQQSAQGQQDEIQWVFLTDV